MSSNATNTIFFDTETTGNTEKDFLIQIAYKNNNEEFTGVYKPPIKILPEASAVHHITNKMVADKPSFKESSDQPKIKALFENPRNVLVAHNAPFDLMIIKKENIVPNNFICTLRVARHLDSEGKIPQYKLQFLRYFLEIEIDATAHDALGDVLVLQQLYLRLAKKIEEKYNLDGDRAIDKMVAISSTPSLLQTFNFGKHLGKKIGDVANTDRGYLEWLLAQKEGSDQIEEDWIYTLRHYLGKLV